jgi:putative ABC transport system permease protein
MKTPPGLAFVSVISQTTANTFWPNRNPIGRSFNWNDVKVTIIGVVGDVKEYGIRTKTIPEAYFPLPLGVADSGFAHLTVKTRTPPTALLGTIRSQIRALDRGLALFRPQTMDEVLANDTHDVSVQAFLLGAFATLALALAAVGLYGVMSYLVTQRTREIGIRMALGAQQSSVLGLILKQGTKLTVMGMLLGAIAAFALTRLIASLLYSVSSADPATFACVAALLTVVALASYYIPARRAAKVDPLKALRYG